MSRKLDVKKRSILDDLNNHLQISASRLRDVSLETNIMTEERSHYSVTKFDRESSKKSVGSRATINGKMPLFKRQKALRDKSRPLRPYDPLYTWNRGGRLKELRIRCQARKYFFIWRNRTIGGVTIERARNHYRSRLIRRAWDIWYSQYWQLRIEPRLFGRAILHRKAVLMRTVFLSWQYYVKIRVDLRNKFEVAVKFHTNRIERDVFNRWESWIFVKKCKFKLKTVSENRVKQKILHRTFSFWKNLWQLKLEEDMKMNDAESHFNRNLKKKVFHEWIKARFILQHWNFKRLKSKNHYESVVIRRTFDGWTHYHDKHKSKLKEKERWNNHYHWNLAHRCLMMWKDRYSISIAQSAFSLKIEKLAKQFQMRKYFINWQRYNENRKIQLFKLEKASEFRKKVIKKQAFSRIKKFSAIRRERKVIEQKARLCYDESILKRYLSRWMARHEEKGDMDQLAELGAARSHYRRTMFVKYLHGWSKYIAASKARNKICEAADSVYQKHLLKRTMTYWRNYVIVSKQQQQVLILEQNFVRNVLERYWLKWKQQFANRKLLDVQLREYLENQKNSERREVFQKWRMLTNTKTKDKMLFHKAVEHFRLSMLNKYFSAIMDFVQSQERKKLNMDLANAQSQQRIMSKVFREWKDYCGQKRYYKNLLLFRFGQIESSVKLSAFNGWRRFVKERLANKKRAAEMYEEKRRALTSEYFRIWRDFIRKRKYRKTQTICLVNEAKLYIDNQCKERIFDMWRKKTASILLQSEKVQKATNFYREKSIKKYFCLWKNFSANQKINSLKSQQSLWFWQKSTQVRIWIVWRQALIDRQREQYYTRFALVHWATKLQAKVLQTWLSYTVEHREQIKKEVEAHNLYRNRLKKFAIRQWISSADFLMQWRNQQNKALNDDSSGIMKAVNQWKRFTQNKKLKSQATKSILISSRSEIENLGAKLFQKKPIQVSRIRPQPKVPSFLLEKKNYDTNKVHLTEPLSKTSPSPPNKQHINSSLDSVDDVLLPPECFERDSNDLLIRKDSKQKHEKDLLKELTHIKERLQHLKESKCILRNLEMELEEYDVLMNKITPRTDSSFHEEFDLSMYREKLVANVEELRREILLENAECVGLTQRFQEIIKILNK